MALRDFLLRERDGIDQLATFQQGLKQRWLDSLQKLNGIIRDGLQPLANEDLLTISESQSTRTETALGSYPVTEFKVSTPAGYKILISPVSRIAPGGASEFNGRVDMFLENRPDIVYVLTPNGTDWSIVPPKEKGIGWDFSAQRPLTRETLEEVLQKLGSLAANETELIERLALERNVSAGLKE